MLQKISKVCYVLSYRCPDVIRTRSLLAALRRIESIELFEAINTSRGLFRYIQTIFLLLSIRIRKNPQVYVLGFRGYEIFLIVRLITFGKPLVFDHMMSPYDSLINERKIINKGGLLDNIIYLYEKTILHLSDKILTDTVPHKNYFIQEFNISREKILDINVGADELIFKKISNDEETNHQGLNVLFYGTFIPLHGIDVILMAANLLKDKPINFFIIGGEGKELDRFYGQWKELNLNNIIHKKWVPYEKLPYYIDIADICLGGPFGGTGQANRVVTCKTFEALAMSKATIIGRSSHDYGFRDKENCLIVEQADYKELADKINWCLENKEKLTIIGENGYNLYKNTFSIDHITMKLKQILC